MDIDLWNGINTFYVGENLPDCLTFNVLLTMHRVMILGK
jgi:hypothetical protein